MNETDRPPVGRTVLRKNDLKLAFLLLLIVILLFLFRSILSGGRGMNVVVTQDGRKTAEYPLSDSRTVTIRTGAGGINVLHIENGKAWVTDASCPDKICEKQGQISAEGQMIVCLPNRLTVSIIK
jgi:hypothetical protein